MHYSIKKIILWGSLGAFAIIGTLIILPWFINPDYLQNVALQQIRQALGSHVQVGRTSLALFPSPHIFISDIVVKEEVASHAVFRAKSMNLELGVAQLFQKKLEVRELVLDHPEIEIRRDEFGVWRFLAHSHEGSALSSLASFLVLGKIEITNGKIIVIDESPSETVRGVVLENVAYMSETSYDDMAVVSALTVSGKLRQTRDFALFQLAGTFDATSNMPLASKNSQNLVFEKLAFTGNMSIDNIDMNQLTELVSNGDFFAKFPGRLGAKSQITWIKKDTTSQLRFSNIVLANPAITLAGNATIEGLKDGNHMTSVSLRSSSLNLDVVRKAISEKWLPDPLRHLWEQGEWGGKLTVADARVTSSTRTDVGTSVTGTFRLNEGFVSIPNWPMIDHVRGTVVVDPDRIHLTDTKGTYDGIPVDVTKGVFLLKDPGMWGDIEIEGPVSAEKVWSFISKLPSSSETSDWQRWKVSQGTGRLRLAFSGEILDGSGLVFQRGDYEPTNVVFHIPGLSYPLSNAQGKIAFSPDSTVFEGVEGRMGLYPFTLNGTIVHQDILRLEPLVITAGIDGKELLPPSSESSLQVMGPLHASMTVRGPVSHFNFKGKIDGEDARISIPSLLRKEVGQASILEIEGDFHRKGLVRLERIELAMLPLRFRGQGVGQVGAAWSWKGRLDSGPISMGVLPEKVQLFGNAIQSGILEIQLDGNGVGQDLNKWNMKGWVALTDGVMAIPGIQESVENVFVRLRIAKELLELKRMEFHIKDSEAVVTGFAKQWQTTPQVSVLWNAPRFDLDLLIPKNERSVLRDGVEWLATHGKLEGSLFIERPKYSSFSGKSLSAVVKVHDNLVSIDNIQSMVEENGNIKGRVFVHLPPGKPAAVRVSFDGKALPFEKILAVMGDDQNVVSGTFNIRGKIQGHGRDKRGIIPTLHGGAELSLRDGYVRQGTVFPKILKILNLPHILRGKVSFKKTGFPYDSVDATLKVERGNFSTKDFLLQSPVMKATIAGAYDYKRDHLDGIAAVSPFGAYSNILKSIPLFGTIFSGDRKGIATAMFSLIGPLKDPLVTYMPKESLKNGLTGLAQLAFDVLKNTVLAPVKVLDGVNKVQGVTIPESSGSLPPNLGKPERNHGTK